MFHFGLISGEDEKYKASELDFHGPSIRGWLSSRNCTYPQEIIFSLENTVVLHQIQILAHHYIIREYIAILYYVFITLIS